MMPRYLILTILSSSVIFLFYTESTEAVMLRLCGSRLADFIKEVCSIRGGFHSPLYKRIAVSAVLSNVSSEIRNTRFSSQPDQAASEYTESDLKRPSDMNPGIANECCKKSCPFSTVVSYCARNEGPEEESTPSSIPKSTQDLTQLGDQYTQDMTEILTTEEPMHQEGGNSPAESKYPNIGIVHRNRPVFIVVSQTQDDSFTENDPEDYKK